MKKILVPIFGAFLSANAGTIDKNFIDSLNYGWHNLGADHNISDLSIFDNAYLLWRFNNDEWKAYSRFPVAKSKIESAGYKTVSSLAPREGFWILKDTISSGTIANSSTGIAFTKSDIESLPIGWSNLGSSSEINNTNIFDIDGLKIVWVFENEKWKAYSPNSQYITWFIQNKYEYNISRIEPNRAFWVYINEKKPVVSDVNLSAIGRTLQFDISMASAGNYSYFVRNGSTELYNGANAKSNININYGDYNLSFCAKPQNGTLEGCTIVNFSISETGLFNNPPATPEANSTSLNRKFLNIEANFTRTGNVVTDHVSGLKWEDQPTIFEGNFSQAEAYCSNLELDGISDWRLPTNKELWYLADRNRSFPAMNPIFKNVKNSSVDFYWTNQHVTLLGSETKYWGFRSDYGFNNWLNYEDVHYIRCVEGKSLYENLEFKRNDNLNTVSDFLHNLMWQDNNETIQKSWSEAISYCENLEYAGYSNWRLPNIEELNSITDQQKTTGVFTNNVFQYTQSYWYWSYTANSSNNTYWSWNLDFKNGRAFYLSQQTNIQEVRCVRDLN